MIKVRRPSVRRIAPFSAASTREISANDLVRDIVRELSECSESVVEVDLDGDGEISGTELTDDAIRVIERMIRSALQNGGIAA